jgi:hypothetical protein
MLFYRPDHCCQYNKYTQLEFLQKVTMPFETETIDRLFLELSQVTKAKTKRELKMESLLMRASVALSGNQVDSMKAVAKAIDEYLSE